MSMEHEHTSEKRPKVRLNMPLPAMETPVKEEADEAMLDRVEQWNKDFKVSAQRALKEIYGYTSAIVLDFKCLRGVPDHDEHDYELKVQVDAESSGKIGGVGLDIIPIIVRRVSRNALRS